VLSSDRRRAAREQVAVGRFAGRRLLDDDDIARLEDRIDAESAARAAYAALADLADDERAVLELMAVDGLAVTDAAAALGISPRCGQGPPAPGPPVGESQHSTAPNPMLPGLRLTRSAARCSRSAS